MSDEILDIDIIYLFLTSILHFRANQYWLDVWKKNLEGQKIVCLKLAYSRTRLHAISAYASGCNSSAAVNAACSSIGRNEEADVILLSQCWSKWCVLFAMHRLDSIFNYSFMIRPFHWTCYVIVMLRAGYINIQITS
jgi:hypothetical protein